MASVKALLGGDHNPTSVKEASRPVFIADYPALSGYLRVLYQYPGVAETVDFARIGQHGYCSHDMINLARSVPQGPILDLAPLMTASASVPSKSVDVHDPVTSEAENRRGLYSGPPSEKMRQLC